eukprot:TRINITY_DN27032_c0_g1_i1.p1 TRINITY_DN27032_c0_g1~~TRINITY_DN27032_c0_g1_i1.p1  ORF type:complete len:429 (-),score=55.27 TRINITY_DN27032_c0_g1_i1:53-1339(-)
MLWGPPPMLLFLTSATLLLETDGLNVVGYVPEYRFPMMDWDAAMRQTTHLVLLSLQPTADGGIAGLDTLRNVLNPNSRLSSVLKSLKSSESSAHVMVGVGGIGRSEAFAEVTASKKLRKRLAKVLASVLHEFPVLMGVDFEWEVPEDAEQWRNLGRLAKDVRAAAGTRGGKEAVLTMTYHPLSKAVSVFGSLRAKSSDKSFVELFDMCHAMTYSLVDNTGRHSTHKMDIDTIDEWKSAGLPMSRLTLGVPLFGIQPQVSDSGSPPTVKTYNEIIENEPALLQNPQTDTTKDGIFFVNKAQVATKIKMASDAGLAGIMVWELGQDLSTTERMLSHIWRSAQGKSSRLASWFRFSFSEDIFFACATAILGGYYTVLVLYRAVRPPAWTAALPARSKKANNFGAPNGAPAAEADKVSVSSDQAAAACNSNE